MILGQMGGCWRARGIHLPKLSLCFLLIFAWPHNPSKRATDCRSSWAPSTPVLASKLLHQQHHHHNDKLTTTTPPISSNDGNHTPPVTLVPAERDLIQTQAPATTPLITTPQMSWQSHLNAESHNETATSNGKTPSAIEEPRDVAAAAAEATATGIHTATISTPKDQQQQQQQQPNDAQKPNEPTTQEVIREPEDATTSGPAEPPTTLAPITSQAPTTPPTTTPYECDIFCLNEGVCVRLEDGQEICICPEGFYGARCQLRDICKTVIADSLTGDKICSRLGSVCLTDDKLFRCRCKEDEYFVFKVDYYRYQPGASGPDTHTAPDSIDSGQPGGGSRTPAAMKEATTTTTTSHQHPQEQPPGSAQAKSSFAYDSPLPLADGPANQAAQEGGTHPNPSQGDTNPPLINNTSKKTYYLAECRRIDKCLGVRCRQLSERCREGECECNRNLGYIRDPRDGLCKLLDPCKMPTPDGQAICGQANCVATYDRELYKCVCPIGYSPIKRGERRSSTQCALLSDRICEIPLLNKCQHLCKVDQKANTYRCSCLPGYVAGTRAGIDDHLCFFDEYLNSASSSFGGGGGGETGDHDYGSPDDSWYQHWRAKATSKRSADETIAYDPPPSSRRRQSAAAAPAAAAAGGSNPMGVRFVFRPVQMPASANETLGSYGRASKANLILKREIVADAGTGPSRGVNKWPEASSLEDASASQKRAPRKGGNPPSEVDYGLSNTVSEFAEQYGDLSLMSAQDRCNMYCEANKICVLEEGSIDSYRCVCDRQGYVSVGDKCLDWCAAAEFRHGVQYDVEFVCYSGLCKRRHEITKPPSDMSSSFYTSSKYNQLPELERGLLKLEARSSWRPSFECDCSSSPVIFKDPQTHLCKLDFEAILDPCLPGNEGHTDCVVNKHAYCSVFHRGLREFLSDEVFEHAAYKTTPALAATSGATAGVGTSAGTSKQQQQQQQQQQKAGIAAANVGTNAKKLNAKLKEKSYTCVCSPEKKFLVDKPRNKARCIGECDLLNNECGRFNRMCRTTTIDSNEDFGYRLNLIRYDPDGVRMNQFRRTGCECLPGFNVGPTEARDFTLDDNYPHDSSSSSNNNNNNNNYPPGADPTTQGALILLGTSAMFNGAGGMAVPYQHLSTDSITNPNLVGPTPPLIEVGGNLLEGNSNIEHLRARYMNINSRCLLDYDVVEFHATFKAPADFEPAWVRVRNTKPLDTEGARRRAGQLVSAPGDAKRPAGSTEGGRGDPQVGEQQSNLMHGPVDFESKNSDSGGGGGGGGLDQNTNHGATQDQQQQDRPYEDSLLRVPEFMRADISELYKHVVLVAKCDFAMAQLSPEAYEACVRYRYWVVQKLRTNFADWRQVMSNNLRETFDLMDGNIRFRVNKCEAIIKRVTTIPKSYAESMLPPSDNSGAGGVASSATTSADHEQPQQQQQQQQDKGLKRSASLKKGGLQQQQQQQQQQEELLAGEVEAIEFDPLDQYARVDADVECELTIHSASDDDRRTARKVLLEKQLPRFIFSEPKSAARHEFSQNSAPSSLPHHQAIPDGAKPAAAATNQANSVAPTVITTTTTNENYYLMAPNMLIARESFDNLSMHRKLFSPCKSEHAYCDQQTRCAMLDSVNYTCTCETGYTPIGSRDIYLNDSRKEVCEDINECLFDVCKLNGLENKSVCVNEIGDYKCQCIRHHVGDNKRYCNHICNVIACKYGDCRIPDEHHAFCECHEGYREPDCSVQDPSVALRKANMIICGSIFASVLLLAITLAISLNSQLKKTKRKLKRLEAAQEAVEFYEFSLQQPPYRQRVSKASTGS